METKIGDLEPQPLIELCGPADPDRIPARLPHEKHILDQEPFTALRDDEQLIPANFFNEGGEHKQNLWYAFFLLTATYPPELLTKYNYNAFVTVRALVKKKWFSPEYSIEQVIEKAHEVQSVLLKNYPFAIPYMQEFRRLYSWGENPGISKNKSIPADFTIPSYAAYAFEKLEAQKRAELLAEHAVGMGRWVGLAGELPDLKTPGSFDETFYKVRLPRKVIIE